MNLSKGWENGHSGIWSTHWESDGRYMQSGREYLIVFDKPISTSFEKYWCLDDSKMFLGKAPASCYCNPEVRHVYKRKGRLCSDLLLICVNILHFIISPSLSQLKCGLGINTAPALTKNWNLHIWTSQGVRVFLFLLPCARRVCFRIDNLIPYTINTWPDGPEFPLFSFNTDWIHSVE